MFEFLIGFFLSAMSYEVFNVKVFWPSYWLSASVCTVVYTFRTVREYKNDKKRRESNPLNYSGTLTVGSILGRIILAFTPLLNLLVVVLDAGDAFLSTGFRWIGKCLKWQVVPPPTPEVRLHLSSIEKDRLYSAISNGFANPDHKVVMNHSTQGLCVLNPHKSWEGDTVCVCYMTSESPTPWNSSPSFRVSISDLTLVRE